MTLADFLLARIAEDEAAAEAATQGTWHWRGDYPAGMNDRSPCVHGTEWTDHGPDLYADAQAVLWAGGYDASGLTVERGDGDHMVRWQPSRVLAECAAKRRIVESAATEPDPCCSCPQCLPIVELAAVYADHPDYLEEWRP